MCKFLWLPILATACAFTSLHADVTAVLHVDGLGGIWDLDTPLMVKGEHARSEFLGIKIFDLKSGGKIALFPKQKWYFKTPAKPAPRRNLTPTGKKDTISGYATDEYTCIIDGMKINLWLTKAMPDYADILKGMAAYYDLDPAALPGIPVRTVSELRAGQNVTTTLISISNRPIADSEFQVPADYERMDELAAHPQ